MKAAFEEDGEEMLMTIDSPDYDSEIDERKTEDSTENESLSEEEQLDETTPAESSNSNAAVVTVVDEDEDEDSTSDAELLAEFNWLKNIMRKKGIIKDKGVKSPEKNKKKSTIR